MTSEQSSGNPGSRSEFLKAVDAWIVVASWAITFALCVTWAIVRWDTLVLIAFGVLVFSVVLAMRLLTDEERRDVLKGKWPRQRGYRRVPASHEEPDSK